VPDLIILNQRGETPADLAVLRDHEDIANLLGVTTAKPEQTLIEGEDEPHKEEVDSSLEVNLDLGLNLLTKLFACDVLNNFKQGSSRASRSISTHTKNRWKTRPQKRSQWSLRLPLVKVSSSYV